MKREQITKNIGLFILAVLVIVVYKTFDSLGILFGYISDFFSLLSPILISFAIAFVLYPSCKKLEDIYSGVKRLSKHKRGLAVATVYTVALAVVSGFFALVLPLIFDSITDLINQLPRIIRNVNKYINSLRIGNYTLKPFINQITITEIMSRFNLTDVGFYVDGIAGFSKGILNVILAIIISVYILLDRAGFLSLIRRLMALLLPKKGRDVFTKYVKQVFSIMYKYIYCQLIDMCIVAIIAFIVLSIIQVQYAPALAIFIGVANLVPYFGAIVACVVTALLTAFSTTFGNGVLVAVVLIVIQQVDANVIQPRLVKNALMVKPFWVLCGITIGSGLFGILGIILAVPVMALIKIIFEDIYEYNMLFEEDDEEQISPEIID